jgi:hypothetical protein
MIQHQASSQRLVGFGADMRVCTKDSHSVALSSSSSQTTHHLHQPSVDELTAGVEMLTLARDESAAHQPLSPFALKVLSSLERKLKQNPGQFQVSRHDKLGTHCLA